MSVCFPLATQLPEIHSLFLYSIQTSFNTIPILSECMLVGKNLVKLNLVGRELKSEFGINP